MTTDALDQAILDRFDELMDLRAERKKIQAETDKLLRDAADTEQLADMAALEKLLQNFTLNTALCVAGFKKANDPETSERKLLEIERLAADITALTELHASECERLIDAIGERIERTSYTCHESHVRPWSVRMTEKLAEQREFTQRAEKLITRNTQNGHNN